MGIAPIPAGGYSISTPPSARPNVAGNSHAAGVFLVASVVIAVSLGLTTFGFSGNTIRSLVFGLGAVILLASLLSLETAVYGVLVAGAIDGLVKGLSSSSYGLLYKDIALWIVLLGWIMRGLNTGQMRSLRHPVALPMFVFALYCMAEVFNCTTLKPVVALAGLRSWIMWIPLALVAYDLFRERWQIERLLMLLLLCSVPACVYGAYQYNRGYSHLKDRSERFDYTDRFISGTGVRAMSTFVHPSVFGASMALTALLLAGGVLYTARGKAWKAALIVGSGVCLIGMATSGSRAPFLALIPSGLVMFSLVRKARALPIFLGIGLAVFVAAMLLLTPGQKLRYSQVTMNRQYIIQRLTNPIVAGLNQALEHPLGVGVATGIGVGRGAELMGGDVEVSREAAAWVEGEYGRVLKELGAPGFLVYCMMMLSCLGWGWYSYRRLQTPSYRALGGALAGVLVAGLVMQGAGSTLYQAPSGPIFWLSCGILIKLSQIEAAERHQFLSLQRSGDPKGGMAHDC